MKELLAMNPRLRRLRKILIAAMLVWAGQAHAHVALTFPHGGESFTAGSIITITWDIVIEHETENWDLYLSLDDGASWNPLVLNLPVGDLEYSWHVPYSASELARIRVVQDNTGMDYFDTSAVFTIVVLPDEGPVFDQVAEDLLIPCDPGVQDVMIQNWLDDHGGAEVTSTCGTVVWTHDYTGLNGSCGVAGDVEVTFSASDDCGVSTTSAHITVFDHTAPVIDIPASGMTIECDLLEQEGEINDWLFDHGGAEASDLCGTLTWTNTFTDLVQGCGIQFTSTIVFTVTDACGNSATTEATLAVEDTTPPEFFTLPRDTVLDCTGTDPSSAVQAWLDMHAGATASDRCTAIMWEHDLTAVPSTCTDGAVFDVHFIVTDACGNASSASASLTLVALVGTSDIPGEGKIRMYPNPATDKIHVEADGLTGLSVELYDGTGRLQRTISSSESQFDISLAQYPAGIYMLVCHYAGGLVVKSIAKR